MHLTKVPFSQTKSFSGFFLDYIEQKEQLKPFYHKFPTIENFSGQIKEKQETFRQDTRDILVRELNAQYKGLPLSESVSTNLTLLRDKNTFTITTGHQLNICTGPLYFIYKIVTVVNACKTLKEKYPQYNFVPVYWMASEDHDYEEIKSFRLFGKKYTWDTKQSGAVGRFSTAGLPELLDTLPENGSLFKEAYRRNKTLSDAVRFYVNELFKEEGVIIIDGDSRALKSIFKNVIKDDILHHTTKKLVEQTNAKLETQGYKTQVYCRDINFFYLDKDIRSRIEKTGDKFTVIDTDITFDEASLERIVDESPEAFSPNVILRPLYQELILPNLAYVGGPAEMIYWLQLKSLFDHHQTPFPILLPRNFALIVEQHVMKKFEKTGLAITDLFQEKNALYSHWVVRNTTHDLTVDDEIGTLRQMFDTLRKQSESIDVTLGPYVAAEAKRAQHSIEQIERKMLRAEKRRHADKLKQIEAVKDQLFPNGSLQERTDNFMNFYSSDPDFIDELIKNFDPFDFQFNILTYNP